MKGRPYEIIRRSRASNHPGNRGFALWRQEAAGSGQGAGRGHQEFQECHEERRQARREEASLVFPRFNPKQNNPAAVTAAGFSLMGGGVSVEREFFARPYFFLGGGTIASL